MDERYDFPDPDTNPQPLFPSAAIAKRIVAQLDVRAAQRGDEEGGIPDWVSNAELVDEILRRFVPLGAEPSAEYAVGRIEAAIKTVGSRSEQMPREDADQAILNLLAGPHILGPSLSLKVDLAAPMTDGCLTWDQYVEAESFAIELAQAKLAAAAFVRSYQHPPLETWLGVRRAVDQPPVLRQRGSVAPARFEYRNKPSIHLRVVQGFGIGIRLKSWDQDGGGGFASDEYVWGADEATPSIWNGQLYDLSVLDPAELPWLSRTIQPLLHLSGLGTRFTISRCQIEAWSESHDLKFAVSVLEGQGYYVITHDTDDAGGDDNGDADEYEAWAAEREEEIRRVQSCN